RRDDEERRSGEVQRRDVRVFLGWILGRDAVHFGGIERGDELLGERRGFRFPVLRPGGRREHGGDEDGGERPDSSRHSPSPAIRRAIYTSNEEHIVVIGAVAARAVPADLANGLKRGPERGQQRASFARRHVERRLKVRQRVVDAGGKIGEQL